VEGKERAERKKTEWSRCPSQLPPSNSSRGRVNGGASQTAQRLQFLLYPPPSPTHTHPGCLPVLCPPLCLPPCFFLAVQCGAVLEPFFLCGGCTCCTHVCVCMCVSTPHTLLFCFLHCIYNCLVGVGVGDEWWEEKWGREEKPFSYRTRQLPVVFGAFFFSPFQSPVCVCVCVCGGGGVTLVRYTPSLRYAQRSTKEKTPRCILLRRDAFLLSFYFFFSCHLFSVFVVVAGSFLFVCFGW
jgi:hypothetical protein